MQTLRIFSAVFLLTGEKPVGIDFVRIILEYFDGINVRKTRDESYSRFADFLIREVKQIVEHNFFVHFLIFPHFILDVSI